MQCHVYRSSVREGLYVWMSEPDALDTLPDAVRRQLGRAELAMTLELTAERKLGQEDAATVLGNLAERGFHVQMPRDIEPEVERAASSAGAPARSRD